MTIERAGRILVAKMGHHKFIPLFGPAGGHTGDCKVCGGFFISSIHTSNFIATSPDFWMKVWTWAKGQEWWDEFIGCYHGTNDVDLGLLIECKLIGSPDFLIELAEFLEGKWRSTC